MFIFDQVYLQTDDKILAIDKENGDVNWSVDNNYSQPDILEHDDFVAILRIDWLKFFSKHDGTEVYNLGCNGVFSHMKLNPDNTKLQYKNGRSFYEYNIENKSVDTIFKHTGSFVPNAFDLDKNNICLTYYHDNKLSLFDLASKANLWSVPQEINYVKDVLIYNNAIIVNARPYSTIHRIEDGYEMYKINNIRLPSILFVNSDSLIFFNNKMVQLIDLNNFTKKVLDIDIKLDEISVSSFNQGVMVISNMNNIVGIDIKREKIIFEISTKIKSFQEIKYSAGRVYALSDNGYLLCYSITPH